MESKVLTGNIQGSDFTGIYDNFRLFLKDSEKILSHLLRELLKEKQLVIDSTKISTNIAFTTSARNVFPVCFSLEYNRSDIEVRIEKSPNFILDILKLEIIQPIGSTTKSYKGFCFLNTYEPRCNSMLLNDLAYPGQLVIDRANQDTFGLYPTIKVTNQIDATSTQYARFMLPIESNYVIYLSQ